MEAWMVVQPPCPTCLPTVVLKSYKRPPLCRASTHLRNTAVRQPRTESDEEKKMEPSLPRWQRQPRGVTTRFSHCKEMSWLVVFFSLPTAVISRMNSFDISRKASEGAIRYHDREVCARYREVGCLPERCCSPF